MYEYILSKLHDLDSEQLDAILGMLTCHEEQTGYTARSEKADPQMHQGEAS